MGMADSWPVRVADGAFLGEVLEIYNPFYDPLFEEVPCGMTAETGGFRFIGYSELLVPRRFVVSNQCNRIISTNGTP
jgi:hypothetical protein